MTAARRASGSHADSSGPEHGQGPSGGRARRGDVRSLLLAALLAGPAHGYELMRRLEEASDGRWRPSPGSVYPSLQLLEEQDLVGTSQGEGRKTYDLTPEGRQQADASLLRGLARDDGPGGTNQALRDALGQLHLATKQVVIAGSSADADQALEILQTARRALYRLLATE